MKTIIISAAALTASLCVASSLHAQAVNWQPVTNISGDSDVYTPPGSTLLYAYYFAPSNVTGSYIVNGVTFQAFGVVNDSNGTTEVGSVSVETSSQFFVDNFTIESNQGAFSQLSEPYQSILSYVLVTSDQFTLTLNDLSAGQTYLFQYWLNASTDSDPAFYETQINTGSNSPVLSANTSGNAGGLGQYVVGSFTVAEGQSSYSFNLQSQNISASITALQVRTIPEPATIALLGLVALVGGIVFRRSRQV